MKQMGQLVLTALFVVVLSLGARSLLNQNADEGAMTSEVPQVIPEPPSGQEICPSQVMWGNACVVWVPKGRFLMGAQADDAAAQGYDPVALPDESPTHLVSLDGFWLQTSEVQVARYRDCVQESACEEPRFVDQAYYVYPSGQSGSMNGVTHAEAATYCAYLGGRLPTEAEWEYAARGGAESRFPWGNKRSCAEGGIAESRRQQVDDEVLREAKDDAAWEKIDCAHSRLPTTQGSFSSRFRLWNMGGSLWEWTSDFYDEEYYKVAPAHNPTGPSAGTKRVQRGGGWMSDLLWDFRSAGRAGVDPELRMPDVGFRCAWSNKAE